MKTRSLTSIAQEILDWTKTDLDGINDITPTEEMLQARIEVARELVRKVKKIKTRNR